MYTSTYIYLFPPITFYKYKNFLNFLVTVFMLLENNIISCIIIYDLIIFNLEVNSEDDVYKVIDEYNEELSIETWQEDNYFNIEDNMFNSYSILPILFYNENIAVNDNITGVTLDCNGNIDFSAIRK